MVTQNGKTIYENLFTKTNSTRSLPIQLYSQLKNMVMLYKSNDISVSSMKKPMMALTKNHRDYNRTFHDSLKYLIIISQFFGLFPLNGVLSSNCKKLAFSWYSVRTIYSLLISLAAILEGIWCAYFLARSNDRFEIYELNVVMFYTRGTLTCLGFLKLAKNWPCLMKEFNSVEKFLRNYPPSKYVYTKLKILTFSIFFLASVEHFTVQAMNFIRASNCENNIWDMFHRFFAYISYRQIFFYIPYNIYIGFMLQMLNSFVTFGWTFIDVFIVYASINFSEKLVQLGNQISLCISERVASPDTWNVLRENYTHILSLFAHFNEQMNDIILVSFTSNIFFLLTQLFAWMRSDSDDEPTLQHIYFMFSIGLLILRTAFVCYYGASIQEESMNIRNTLVAIPSNLYNEEVERFIVEVNSSPMILSGNRYFHITRGLILKIAGSIVTYELVMIQFTADITKEVMEHQC